MSMKYMPFTKDPIVYPCNRKYFTCGVCNTSYLGFEMLARHFKKAHLKDMFKEC